MPHLLYSHYEHNKVRTCHCWRCLSFIDPDQFGKTAENIQFCKEFIITHPLLRFIGKFNLLSGKAIAVYDEWSELEIWDVSPSYCELDMDKHTFKYIFLEAASVRSGRGRPAFLRHHFDYLKRHGMLEELEKEPKYCPPKPIPPPPPPVTNADIERYRKLHAEGRLKFKSGQQLEWDEAWERHKHMLQVCKSDFY